MARGKATKVSKHPAHSLTPRLRAVPLAAGTCCPRAAFCVDTPDQLAKLSPRLQQTHADLLPRCGLDQETYPQFIHTQQRRGAQDTTPYVQDTARYAQDIANKYKEEVWISIRKTLKLEISPSNYETYLRGTRVAEVAA